MQPEVILAHALTHPQGSESHISEYYRFAKNPIWTILYKLDAHPYLPTFLQPLAT